jgi:hypothetical protein
LSNFVLLNPNYHYQPLQVRKLDYSSSQEDSGAFGEVDIPEEQRLKERQVDTQVGWSYRLKDKVRGLNRRKVLELYTKPTRRPVYSLQILCLIEISRNNHPEEQIYTLNLTINSSLRTPPLRAHIIKNK